MKRHALFSCVSVVLLTLTGYCDAQSNVAVEMGQGVGRFVAKAERGDALHVAFFGGSITQNVKGHSAMLPEWLRKRWPKCQITDWNAGLSSTGSITGAFRFAKDVLAKGPVDLLVLEFAVNDDQDAMLDREMAIRGFEGIVRQYFAANPEGDIITVQFVNPEILEKQLKGEEAVSVEAHKAVARHYKLASVDVGLALSKQIQEGKMNWDRDYGGTHPKEAGYRFVTDMITEVITNSAPDSPRIPGDLPEKLNEDCFDHVSELDLSALDSLGGWERISISKDTLPVGTIRKDFMDRQALRSDSPGDYLYCSFVGSSLSAFVLAGPDAGELEVSVDGGDWEKMDLYHAYSEGLNYPRTLLLADKLPLGGHSVAIRNADEKNSKSQGHAVTILEVSVAGEGR